MPLESRLLPTDPKRGDEHLTPLPLYGSDNQYGSISNAFGLLGQFIGLRFHGRWTLLQQIPL